MAVGRAPIAFEEDLLFIDIESPDDHPPTSAAQPSVQDKYDNQARMSDLTNNVSSSRQHSIADSGEEDPMLPSGEARSKYMASQWHHTEEMHDDVDKKRKGDNPPSNVEKLKDGRAVIKTDNDDFEWLSSSDLQETCLVGDLDSEGACVAPDDSLREDGGFGSDHDDHLPQGKHSALSDSHENMDNDSTADLFSQEQRMTPSAYRKEYLCGIFLKYSIFIFNFLFWVASVCAFGFGYWLFTSKGHLFSGGVYVMLDPAVLLCVVGLTIFLVAFLGFLGALRENLLLLIIFRVSLVMVLLVQIGVGLMMFVFYTMPEARKSILSGPEGVLKDAIKHYHDEKEMREWIDLIQKEFECCGISHSNEGFRDWQINMYFNCSRQNPSIQRCAVPVSCCILEPGDYVNVMCGFDTSNQDREDVLNRIYTKGCMQGLADWMRSNESFIGAFLLIFITPQVLGVIFSTLYIKHIRNNRARWRRLEAT